MDFLQLTLRPWPARGIAFVLGAIGALAFAPIFLLPALILALSGIWFILEQNINHLRDITNKDRHCEEAKPTWQSLDCFAPLAMMKSVFWLGWWFGLGHFTAGLYWIANALTVDLSAFWWLIPFALFGIPAVLAVFTGLAFVGAALWPYKGISRAFAFAAIWVGVEWIRGHIFTGFPWNLLGYAWAISPEMLQSASLWGVYGLSLLTLLLSITLTSFVGKQRTIAISVYLIAGLVWYWGYDRLNYPNVISSPPFALRIVQPNIAQTLKWDAKSQEDNFSLLLEMTKRPSTFPLKAVIWPESAVSFFLEQEAFRRELIAQAIPKDALIFIGAIRRTPKDVTPREVWNSLLVLNDKGSIIAYYDKAHLVPFGEYLPFRPTLDSLFGKGTIKKVTVGTIDFSSGPGPQTVKLPEGFPAFSGLVCYEVIFPSAVINKDQPRPGWMINITNDAWYGNSSGPYQHLEMTRFRAVEEGIPIVRAANNGVSALFDAYGRNMGDIGLNKREVLDVFLPTPTYNVPPYARWGDWITLALILGTFAFAWALSWKKE